MDNLDDLFNEVQLLEAAKNPVRKKPVDPAMRQLSNAEQQREIYTNPDNWMRTRTVALVDKGTKTLLGNFSEYVHKRFPLTTRKLLRETAPLVADAVEEVDGYIGDGPSFRLRNSGQWTESRTCFVNVVFPELMVKSYAVKLTVHLFLGGIVRVDLAENEQFASESGNTILCLPAGTNVLDQLSPDTKKEIRKEIGL